MMFLGYSRRGPGPWPPRLSEMIGMDIGFLTSVTGLTAWALLIVGALAAALGVRGHIALAAAGAALAVAGVAVMMIAAGAVSADWWPLGRDGLWGLT
jgi:hypothetical protein